MPSQGASSLSNSNCPPFTKINSGPIAVSLPSPTEPKAVHPAPAQKKSYAHPEIRSTLRTQKKIDTQVWLMIWWSFISVFLIVCLQFACLSVTFPLFCHFSRRGLGYKWSSWTSPLLGKSSHQDHLDTSTFILLKCYDFITQRKITWEVSLYSSSDWFWSNLVSGFQLVQSKLSKAVHKIHTPNFKELILKKIMLQTAP